MARAREAEARATYLENELRAASALAATEAPLPTDEEETISAFAANTDVDMPYALAHALIWSGGWRICRRRRRLSGA
ncbi:MAG: hypothetical protein R3C16_05690 [Hyphomonadaceae bacterium]